MVSAHGWRPSGGVRSSTVAARRDASALPSGYLRSTLAPDSFRFPRERRLCRRQEIDLVRKKGKRARTASLEVRAHASLHASDQVGKEVSHDTPERSDSDDLHHRRLAETDGRVRGRVCILAPLHKHGTTERNRLKRRLREIVRLEILPEMKALDVVIRALPGAYDRSFNELRGELLQLKEFLSGQPKQ